MVKTEPTWKRDALLHVVSNFEHVHDLSKQQSATIKSFTSGTDTFASLPTGHGKSFLYQLAIPLTKALRKHLELWFSQPVRPMLLGLSPLNVLISDHTKTFLALCLHVIFASENRFGLGSKPYLSNALRMLNKNLTRFVQSLFSVQSICTVP